MALSLDTILKGKTKDPARIVIYGVNGIGKTTFAAKAPNVIGVLTEEGMGHLDFPRFPLCQSFDQVMECLRSLYTEKHTYKTVMLDSLDWLERLIFRVVAADAGKGSIEEIGYGKGYVLALNYWEKVLSALDHLRKEKQMVSVLIGHCIVKTYNAPDSDSYDRYRLDLHDKSASLIRDWADVIIFANYKTFVTSTADGKRNIAIGEGERVMFTEERPAFWAKNRYSLPFEMPLDFAALETQIKGQNGHGKA